MEESSNPLKKTRPKTRGFFIYILFSTILRAVIQTALLVLLLRVAPSIEAAIQPQWVQAANLFLLVMVPLFTILVLFRKTRAIASLGIALSSLVGQLVLLVGSLIIVTSLTPFVWIVLGVWLWNGLGLGLWVWLLWRLAFSWEGFFVKTRTIGTAFNNLGLVAVTIGASALKERWDIAGPLLLGFTGCLILSAVVMKVQLQVQGDRIADIESAATANLDNNP